jgi:hypothetical protein
MTGKMNISENGIGGEAFRLNRKNAWYEPVQQIAGALGHKKTPALMCGGSFVR